ncbi:DUF2637 domain-containing protein [Streptomyces sp. NPDC004311]|uniref:DUF2637 domain-containing protein n=1 Tax=Streptomyces sp. NPDC004311 TaxID=3364698 RepID=UPI0036784891
MRTATAVVGLIAAAISYDGLRYLAAAGHLSGSEATLFPLVTGGFTLYSAYAIAALAGAPLRERAYAWMGFTLGTAVAIWANVLRGLGLNQHTDPHGWRLDDIPVALFSAISPLAAAGALLLWLLLSQHTGKAARHRNDTESAQGTTTNGGTAR